jgi:hypothetical protein
MSATADETIAGLTLDSDTPMHTAGDRDWETDDMRSSPPVKTAEEGSDKVNETSSSDVGDNKNSISTTSASQTTDNETTPKPEHGV